MKKMFLMLVLALSVCTVKADEGMWFLMHIERLNHRDMQKMGLQLTSEEIYSINHASLKDAIVQFGGGCTAEIVSETGLVMTNHHCGYGAIAELSTPEHDYLSDGYWAPTRDQELKPEELSVRFFVRMDGVSERILGLVNADMSEAERQEIIDQEIAKIKSENSEGGKYVVSVKSFYEGNEYYYFVYQDYTDVRLVGTPPKSIGKFGGDTDNWEWPRHTGDFSLFRIYADTQGNPADYNQNNVPLKPKYHLPISLKGFKDGDFAMIMGYPGRTNRWMPAAGVNQNVKFSYPAWVDASKLAMDVMKKYMNQSTAVNLQYASKYAGVANYWKNRQGMIDALTQHETAEKKAAQEAVFNLWANQPEHKATYGSVLEDINTYYAETNEQARHDNYLEGGVLRSSSMSIFPYIIGTTMQFYTQQDSATKAMILPKIQQEVEKQYAELYLPLEKEMLGAMLDLYARKGGEGFVAPEITALYEANNRDLKTYVDQHWDTSIFASKDRLVAFLKNPQSMVLEEDPLCLISSSLIAHFQENSPEAEEREATFQKAFRLLVQGMRESNPDVKYYPDANSTLRLSYGKIRSLPLDPENDAQENFYTTLKGTVTKYQPGDDEFDLPQELLDLYEKKDFGPYADKAGYLPVNFLTDNDITGGNSGSPVINGEGHLIGLAFDGNIEAMAGDVIFDPELQRTIAVDIRYVLFLIDKFAGAEHIVKEFDLVQ